MLLVDDNPADVGVAREALVKSIRHSEITSVEDGMEAMAFLDRRGKYASATRPDLVILDLSLPKKDGLAVLAAIKARPELHPGGDFQCLSAGKGYCAQLRPGGELLRQ